MYYFPQPYDVRARTNPYRSPETKMAFNQRYKLYHTGELYDRQEDPLELNPLPSDDPDTAEIRETLQEVVDQGFGTGLGLDWVFVANRTGRRPRKPPCSSAK